MSRSDAKELKIFAGRNHRTLAETMCRHLDIPIGEARTIVFPDTFIQALMKVVAFHMLKL